MSKDDIQTFSKALLATLEGIRTGQEQRAATERTRRAKLTPEQRAAEDRAVAQRSAQAARDKLRAQVKGMGDAVLKRETWTLDEFAWLLAAASPEGDSWSLIDTRSGKEEKIHRTSLTILRSCVGASLHAVNPTEPSGKHRYSVRALLVTARHRQLGYFDILEELIGSDAPAAAVAPAPDSRRSQAKPAPEKLKLAKAGQQTREQQKVKRQRDLAEFVRSQVDEKMATVTGDAIVFPIHGIELIAIFTKAYPQWKGFTLGTFARDRKEMRPRIEVKPGRPPNKDG